MPEWFGRAWNQANSVLMNWACVIVGSFLLGFLAGYWVGHGEITGFRQTARAFVWLPFLWLGNAEMFYAYAVTAVAWYLPPHYDSRWPKIVGAVANPVVWFLVIHHVVVKTAQGKFFQY